jgi:Flp pilus assembly pilin Flp
MKSRDINKSNLNPGLASGVLPDGGTSMMTAPDSREQTAMGRLRAHLERFHADESGVAMTEYIIVFSLLSLGATISLIIVTAFIKGYRDFLVWWLGHPMV